MEKNTFKYEKQIAIIVGVEDYSMIQSTSSGTSKPLQSNKDAVMDLETMRAGIVDLNFGDCRTYFNPSSTKLKLMFNALKRELANSANEGKSTLVLFYFSGHGFRDANGVPQVCLNRPSLKAEKAINSTMEQFVFNLGQYLKEIGDQPSAYLVSVLDFSMDSDQVASQIESKWD